MIGLHVIGDVDMDISDTATVQVYVWGATKIVGVDGHATVLVTHFSGHRIA